MFLVATAPTTVGAEPRGGGEVLKLAPVEVKGSRYDFEFDAEYDDVSTKVQGVRVTWVSPATEKVGLRVGDRMVSIDGKRVTDLSLEDFLAVTKRKVGPGESQIIKFTRRRMLVLPVTVTYTATGPNKVPEPSPAVVTPPSAQEPNRR